jgi:hypothetical protein
MKNGKHTTLFVILLFLTNLFANNKLFSNTILAIQVENGSTNSISISCLEEVLSEKKWQKNLDLQVSKHYVLDFDLKAPKAFQVTYNGSDYEIYLEPNDSLVLHINGKYFPHQLNIQGIGKERNVLLYNFYEKFEANPLLSIVNLWMHNFVKNGTILIRFIRFLDKNQAQILSISSM